MTKGTTKTAATKTTVSRTVTTKSISTPKKKIAKTKATSMLKGDDGKKKVKRRRVTKKRIISAESGSNLYVKNVIVKKGETVEVKEDGGGVLRIDEIVVEAGGKLIKEAKSSCIGTIIEQPGSTIVNKC